MFNSFTFTSVFRTSDAAPMFSGRQRWLTVLALACHLSRYVVIVWTGSCCFCGHGDELL